MTTPLLLSPENHNRANFIGGSDIGAIMGLNPYRNAVDVWLDKIRPESRADIDNPATRRGRRMEPVVLQWAAEDYGLVVEHRNRRFQDASVPFFCAEIDAETTEQGAPANVEVKTVHPFLAKEWGETGTDGLPMHYLCQTHWGLTITQRQLCIVYAAIGDELQPYIVERDDGLIELMRHEAQTFWRDHVMTGIRPEIDAAHPRIFETLKRMFPGTSGAAMAASTQHEAWYQTMVEAREKAASYEAVASGAQAHLVAEMGECAQLVFADGQALKRAQRKRKGYTVDAIEYWDIRLGKAKEAGTKEPAGQGD